MKKPKTFAVISVLLLFSSFSFAQEENGTPPEAVFLTKCFKDYVEQVEKPNEKVKKRCISIPFRTEWKGLLEKLKTDPLLLSDNVKKTWAKHIEIDILNVKKGRAKILFGEEEDTHCLMVQFEKSGDDMRISSTKKCSGK